MWGAGWTYSEYSAGQNEGPEAVSGLFAFIPPPKGSGCSRSGYNHFWQAGQLKTGGKLKVGRFWLCCLYLKC